MNRTVVFQTYWNISDAEQRRSGVSDISERGVEGEMVNPERSWSGVIIKCSERGGEIVASPLRSHTLGSNKQEVTTVDGAKDRCYSSLPLWKRQAVFKMPSIILLLLFLQHPVCMLCIVCKFSVCMEYPNYLLYLLESAKYNSSTLKWVQKLCSEWHTIIQLLLYCSMLCVYYE